MKKDFLFVLLGLSLALSACSSKSGEEGLQKILSSSEPPAGVVFEIASGDETGLKWAIPIVRSYTKQLRDKFPGIKLAVVSHGEEQFQLTKDNQQNFADTHQQVVNLNKNQGVEIHVCGNYAASAGVDEDEFVGYIDVAARGPAQVKAYERAGYAVLFIDNPNTQH